LSRNIQYKGKIFLKDFPLFGGEDKKIFFREIRFYENEKVNIFAYLIFFGLE
jgi:hypothetical protein